MAATTERLAVQPLIHSRFTGSRRQERIVDLSEAGTDADADDAAANSAYPALTAAEAQALRAANPSLSPWRVVAAQLLIGAGCVVVAWLVSQRANVACSALYGAAATVLPSALMARGMTRGTRSAVASAAAFMFWEMLKVGVAVAMMVIAVRVVPHLSWPALLATMVVCIKVNWFALLWRGSRPERHPESGPNDSPMSKA